MAGMIINTYSEHAVSGFCKKISNMIDDINDNNNFILKHKVEFATINRKQYIYISMKIDTAKYVMYILHTGSTIQDKINKIQIPNEFGINGYKFNIINVD